MTTQHDAYFGYDGTPGKQASHGGPRTHAARRIPGPTRAQRQAQAAGMAQFLLAQPFTPAVAVDLAARVLRNAAHTPGGAR